jgi:hypothetical protein
MPGTKHISGHCVDLGTPKARRMERDDDEGADDLSHGDGLQGLQP